MSEKQKVRADWNDERKKAFIDSVIEILGPDSERSCDNGVKNSEWTRINSRPFS
jgi:hypothetical protein